MSLQKNNKATSCYHKMGIIKTRNGPDRTGPKSTMNKKRNLRNTALAPCALM